ncbi:hypothetical protein, partial [Priestia megaterium]|uniref:hypothetical protein n=1 Tax=Priestia megaterium TaxID=1404 RepID=UPI00302EBD92
GIQEELCSILKCSNIVKKSKGTKKKLSKVIEDSQLIRCILSSIFNYNKFSNDDINNWNAYHYCKYLGVNVCPYCNRIYTHTIMNKDENIIRPSLDHYIPQSRYPLFGLSFFNLIPSCTYCNSSIKNDKDDFTLEHKVFDNYLHPYFDDGKFSFQFKPFDINGFNGKKDKIKIEIINEENKKVKNSLVFFKVADIYQVHNDIVASLISKRIKYNDESLKMIGKLIKVEKEELFKIAFDTIEEEDIIDYSLGKLKRDITNQLKKLTL